MSSSTILTYLLKMSNQMTRFLNRQRIRHQCESLILRSVPKLLTAIRKVLNKNRRDQTSIQIYFNKRSRRRTRKFLPRRSGNRLRHQKSVSLCQLKKSVKAAKDSRVLLKKRAKNESILKKLMQMMKLSKSPNQSIFTLKLKHQTI